MHCLWHVIICWKSGGSYYMTTNDLVKFFSLNNTKVGIVPQHVGLLKFRPFKLVSQVCFWDTGPQEVSCSWNPLSIKVAQYHRQWHISTKQYVASCGCSTITLYLATYWSKVHIYPTLDVFKLRWGYHVRIWPRHLIQELDRRITWVRKNCLAISIQPTDTLATAYTTVIPERQMEQVTTQHHCLQ